MDNQPKAIKVKDIKVDGNLCIGAATCVALAEKAFKLNAQNISEVLPTALEHTDDELLTAARSCPVQAIKLFDEEGNEIHL